MSAPVIFVSYSHKDWLEKDKLLSHLGVLRNFGPIDLWDDERIKVGSDWQRAITQAVGTAKVAILLITANYLNSDFVREIEIPQLLERSQNEGLVVFPLIAKACSWKRVSWLQAMQVRPRNGAPVWRDDGAHVDEELTAIVDEIADQIPQGKHSESNVPISASTLEPLAPRRDVAISIPSERKLLIVDDDPLHRRSVKFALKDEGITFFEASSVQEALYQLNAEADTKVILLDLQLAGGGVGTQLLEKIKDRKSNYRIIIWTAHTEMMAANIARQYDVFTYAIKPTEFEDPAPALQFTIKRAFEDAEEQEKAEAGTLDRMILDEYPTPFATIYEELKHHLTPERRFVRIINIFELLMHFSAVTLLAEYLNNENRIAELDEVIRDRITKPSLGEWFNLSCEVLKRKKQLQHGFFLNRFSLLFKGKNREAMSRMITTRNDHYGHSAAHREWEYEDLVRDCSQALETLLKDFAFIASLLLCYVQDDSKRKGTYIHRLIEFKGRNYNQGVSERSFSSSLESHEVLIVDVETERTQSLHPFIVLERCSECRQVEIFFYTKTEGDKLQYMSYSSGHKVYSRESVRNLTSLLQNTP